MLFRSVDKPWLMGIRAFRGLALACNAEWKPLRDTHFRIGPPFHVKSTLVRPVTISPTSPRSSHQKNGDSRTGLREELARQRPVCFLQKMSLEGWSSCDTPTPQAANLCAHPLPFNWVNTTTFIILWVLHNFNSLYPNKPNPGLWVALIGQKGEVYKEWPINAKGKRDNELQLPGFLILILNNDWIKAEMVTK